jgi:hypothetical protein
MSFEVRAIDAHTWEVSIPGEPAHIHALKMAPESIEPELMQGVWLVVAFPVWSAPVRESVSAALGCARDNSGLYQLGIRPFESHDELRTWWPLCGAPAVTGLALSAWRGGLGLDIRISPRSSNDPLWLVLDEGRVAYHGCGPRSEAHLRALVQDVI